MSQFLRVLLIPTVALCVWPTATAGQQGAGERAAGQPGVGTADSAAARDTAAAVAAEPSLPPGQVDVTPDSTAPAPPPPAPRPPPVTPAFGVSIKLAGLVQAQGSTSSIDSVTNFDQELRRMRLVTDADAGSGFSGRLMMDFDSNRARVRDAYANWRATSALSFRVGQFKPPFNTLETTAAKDLPLIERGNRIRGALGTRTTSNLLSDAHYAARNRGLMATVKLPSRFTLYGGAWLGSGEAGEDNDGKQFAGRLEWSALKLPGKYSKPLVFGAAVSTNGFFGSPRDTLKVVSGDSLVVEDAVYGTALEGSVEYGAYGLPGIHAAANVFTGDNPFVLENGGGNVNLATFFAFQTWGEYVVSTGARVISGVAPAFRVDRLDPNTDGENSGNWFLTPGVNVYFAQNFKLAVNYEFLIPDADELDTESALRVQTQLIF